MMYHFLCMAVPYIICEVILTRRSFHKCFKERRGRENLPLCVRAHFIGVVLFMVYTYMVLCITGIGTIVW